MASKGGPTSTPRGSPLASLLRQVSYVVCGVEEGSLPVRFVSHCFAQQDFDPEEVFGSASGDGRATGSALAEASALTDVEALAPLGVSAERFRIACEELEAAKAEQVRLMLEGATGYTVGLMRKRSGVLAMASLAFRQYIEPGSQRRCCVGVVVDLSLCVSARDLVQAVLDRELAALCRQHKRVFDQCAEVLEKEGASAFFHEQLNRTPLSATAGQSDEGSASRCSFSEGNVPPSPDFSSCGQSFSGDELLSEADSGSPRGMSGSDNEYGSSRRRGRGDPRIGRSATTGGARPSRRVRPMEERLLNVSRSASASRIVCIAEDKPVSRRRSFTEEDARLLALETHEEKANKSSEEGAGYDDAMPLSASEFKESLGDSQVLKRRQAIKRKTWNAGATLQQYRGRVGASSSSAAAPFFRAEEGDGQSDYLRGDSRGADASSESPRKRKPLSPASSTSSLLSRRRGVRIEMLDMKGYNESKERLQSHRHMLTAEGYTLGGTIGCSGNRSFVVISAQKGLRQVAVKCAEEPRGEGTLADVLRHEFEVLRKLQRHRNIVEVLRFVEADLGSALVMEFCLGVKLASLLPFDAKSPGPLTDEMRHSTIDQILTVVEYMHQRRVAHRDLHSENIMCDIRTDYSHEVPRHAADVKVIDFGCARFEGEPATSSLHIFDDTNVAILAPYAFAGGDNMFACDVFAVGLLALGAMVGREVFTKDITLPHRGGEGTPASSEGSSRGSLRVELPQAEGPARIRTGVANRYLHALLNVNQEVRLRAKEAREQLVPSDQWFEPEHEEPAHSGSAEGARGASKSEYATASPVACADWLHRVLCCRLR